MRFNNLMVIAVLHLTACSTVNPASPTLDVLRQGFAEIRHDPPRSDWPAIPGVDPEPLIGMPAFAVRSALGHSDRRTKYSDWNAGRLCVGSLRTTASNHGPTLSWIRRRPDWKLWLSPPEGHHCSFSG